MGVRFDARGHAHQRVHGRTRAHELAQSFDLIEVVHDQAMHTFFYCARDLFFGFVIAVHDHATGRHARAQHEVEFTPRRHVDTQPFFERQAGHGATEERLRREGDAVVKGARRFVTARAQRRLVVDEKGRAVCLSELA